MRIERIVQNNVASIPRTEFMSKEFKEEVEKLRGCDGEFVFFV